MLILFAWLQDCKVWLPAWLEPWSLVPISRDNSEAKIETANNSNQATTYGNETDHLQAKAHKQLLTRTTAIFILGKKTTIPWTTMLDNLTKAICRTSSFVCPCENKTERCFSLLNGVTLYVQGISVCQQICAEEKDTAEADWTKCFT